VRVPLFASVVNLNHPGHYLHWGVIQISVGNVAVVGLMVTTFVIALIAPFPGSRRKDDE
jgi:hypothetical protein